MMDLYEEEQSPLKQTLGESPGYEMLATSNVLNLSIR